MSLLQMIDQLVTAIESIHTSTVAARDMAIMNVLGSEVLPVVTPQVSSALEDAWTEVAGMKEGSCRVGGNTGCCIGSDGHSARVEGGRMCRGGVAGEGLVCLILGGGDGFLVRVRHVVSTSGVPTHSACISDSWERRRLRSV
jgi:hypothetical protein